MYQFFVIQSQTREALRGHDDFKIHEALFGKEVVVHLVPSVA